MKERGEGRKERRGRMREQLARETPKKNHNTFFIYFLISEYTHTLGESCRANTATYILDCAPSHSASLVSLHSFFIFTL